RAAGWSPTSPSPGAAPPIRCERDGRVEPLLGPGYDRKILTREGIRPIAGPTAVARRNRDAADRINQGALNGPSSPFAGEWPGSSMARPWRSPTTSTWRPSAPARSKPIQAAHFVSNPAGTPGGSEGSGAWDDAPIVWPPLHHRPVVEVVLSP